MMRYCLIAVVCLGLAATAAARSNPVITLDTWETITTDIPQFKQVNAVRVDTDGNIYVWDLGASRLYKVSPDGKLIWSTSPEWPGPEQTRIGGLSPDLQLSTDGAFLNDLSQSKIRHITPDGQPAPEVTVPVMPLSFVATPGRVFTYNYVQGREGVIETYDLAGRCLNRFGRDILYAHNDEEFHRPRTGCTTEATGEDRSLLAVSGDRIYLVSSYWPVIRVYDTAGHIRETFQYWDRLPEAWRTHYADYHPWNRAQLELVMLEGRNPGKFHNWLVNNCVVQGDVLYLWLNGNKLLTLHPRPADDRFYSVKTNLTPQTWFWRVDVHDGWLYAGSLRPTSPGRIYRTRLLPEESDR